MFSKQKLQDILDWCINETNEPDQKKQKLNGFGDNPVRDDMSFSVINQYYHYHYHYYCLVLSLLLLLSSLPLLFIITVFSFLFII